MRCPVGTRSCHGHAGVPIDDPREVHPGRYPEGALSWKDFVLGQLLLTSITGTELNTTPELQIYKTQDITTFIVIVSRTCAEIPDKTKPQYSVHSAMASGGGGGFQWHSNSVRPSPMCNAKFCMENVAATCNRLACYFLNCQNKDFYRFYF